MCFVFVPVVIIREVSQRTHAEAVAGVRRLEGPGLRRGQSCTAGPDRSGGCSRRCLAGLARAARGMPCEGLVNSRVGGPTACAAW